MGTSGRCRGREVAIAAALAGAVGGVPSTVHALVTGGDPLAATRAASTLIEVLHPRAPRHRLVEVIRPRAPRCTSSRVVERVGRPRAMPPGGWRVSAGVAAHAAVSLAWAAVLVPVLRRVPRATGRGSRMSVVLVGAVAGLGIAALDLWIARHRFPLIAGLPMLPQVADHLVYGAVLGVVVARRRETV